MEIVPIMSTPKNIAPAKEPTARIALIASRKKADDPNLSRAYNALPPSASVCMIHFDARQDLNQSLRSLKAKGFERALVCGGDGTLHLAIEEMLNIPPEQRVPIGVVPLGTGNDFAGASGFGKEDLEEAVRKTAETPVRKVDIGLCNGRPFINVASAGVAARVTTEVKETLKHSLGKFSYVLNGLKEAANRELYSLKFQSDGWTHEESCLAFIVGNSATAGGGFKVAPHAKIDDGKLDLLIVPDQGLPSLAALAAELLQEEPDLSRHTVSYRQVSRLSVESDRELQINLDGEPIFAQSLEFSVLPQALEIAVSDELLAHRDWMASRRF